MDNSPKNLPNLEESLNEITHLIDQMEHDQPTLENCLASFERGIILIRHAQKILQEAEQKVQILMQKNGNEELSSYENPEQ